MFYKFCYGSRKYLTNGLSPVFYIRRYISQSYYDILKVSPTCTSKEIREAFIHLSKKNHPDKHLNDPSMHDKFVQINEAYSTLINPSKRRSYDLTLYNKRKLNPPYDNPFHGRTSAYNDSFRTQKSSRNTSYTSSSGHDYYKDPFSWQEIKYDRQSQNTSRSEFRRYSNTHIVGVLVTFTLFGMLIQLLVIRKSLLSNHEKRLEKSNEYELIHTLTRERAKLYGNTHQIEVLKSNLNSSFEPDKNELEPNKPNNLIPILTQGKNESQRKCSLHGSRDTLNIVSANIQMHHSDVNHIDNADKKRENHNEMDVKILPVNNEKICKKCHKKINK